MTMPEAIELAYGVFHDFVESTGLEGGSAAIRANQLHRLWLTQGYQALPRPVKEYIERKEEPNVVASAQVQRPYQHQGRG